jgi:cation-transporting ATPase E
MTEGIKKYSKEVSPIQHSVDLVIKYSSYVLLLGIIFVIVRGIITHSSLVRVVLSVGALSSFLVPQGLVFALTLFFAYGAINLFRRNVLLQEVNATEKLGRIKNLCMDKTGTLTENTLAVESMHVPGVITKEDARRLTSAYIQGTHDSSEIMRAVSKFINYEYKGKNEEAVTFSSWRQYGGVRIQDKVSNTIVLVGSADIFLPQVVAGEQKKWLEQIIDTNSHQGRHVLCIVQTTGTVLPKNLSREKLSIVAAFVFYNNLREGIRTTIGFFQNRGVSIRIISGDNPETVRTVAELSGVKNTDRLITGKEMEAWSATDFELKVKSYALFARILPEQKEKIIEAFKKNGFTAMVGDGANDALAIKKADLGIAMFDGAQATRQLASVVLTNNSFTALPGGVRLADVIIKNIEIFSSVFFNQMLLGLFFFIIISILGRDFPFTPLNITFINYFTVGIPSLLVSYWTIRPIRKIYPMAQGSFLKRVLPFVFWSTVLQIIGVVVIYVLSPDYLKMAESNTLVILAFIVFGLVFFACAPSVYHGSTTKSEKRQISILLAFEILLIFIALHIAFFNTFFNLTYLSLPIKTSLEVLGVLLVYCYLQYLVSRLFSVPPSKKLS